jgi:hypothetical protein
MGLTTRRPDASMSPIEAPFGRTVNPSTPPSPQPQPLSDAAFANLLAWHELQREMEELHARLQYLRLMLKLGVPAG